MNFQRFFENIQKISMNFQTFFMKILPIFMKFLRIFEKFQNFSENIRKNICVTNLIKNEFNLYLNFVQFLITLHF
ncbi:MAG: hypothetical protein QW197_00885 [Candidatus Aenigmatarchaeota archaeon]